MLEGEGSTLCVKKLDATCWGLLLGLNGISCSFGFGRGILMNASKCDPIKLYNCSKLPFKEF